MGGIRKGGQLPGVSASLVPRHCLGHRPLPQNMPGAHLQGPGGHAVHDGRPLQAALLQLPQVHLIELLQVLGDGQVVICRRRAEGQGSGVSVDPSPPRTDGACRAPRRDLPSMTCRWPWMISSQRARCCSRRRRASRRWRSAPSRSSACDCIAAFSTSSSCTRHSRLSAWRCSSEPMRPGSVSSRRRPCALSSRQRCSRASCGGGAGVSAGSRPGPPPLARPVLAPPVPGPPPGGSLPRPRPRRGILGLATRGCSHAAPLCQLWLLWPQTPPPPAHLVPPGLTGPESPWLGCSPEQEAKSRHPGALSKCSLPFWESSEREGHLFHLLHHPPGCTVTPALYGEEVEGQRGH